ncbi:DUF2130 domain-containing protein [Rhodoplanes sp. Z2-YC6860]|uniref:DUF2130 domain-containing protein n=1 Tax=Rhodoplanes sp. Z2-YC6860 TaxID=674703 RepID=UPI000829860C|nr:DUF2130 domain-containing protein [Rhodoplanes sp. Z2-YC6860]
MTDLIACPNCKTEIKLTEQLAAPLIAATRRQYEQRLADKDGEIAKREQSVRDQQAALEKEKGVIAQTVAERISAERATIAAEEAKKAKMLAATDLEQKGKELADLKQVLQQRDEKLAEAQRAQVELIKKQRELDDAKREMDLTIEKRVSESLGSVRDKARQAAEEGYKLRVAEKEEQISSMQRQIEELKRKAEQGSQQLQGEVLELELETTLRSKFPRDAIEPVPKGEFGGDLLHRVIGPQNQPCGTILWESKRTKNWSDGWLSKLRDDQRAAKAEMALIVSNALPKDIKSFDLIDGVWVTEMRCALPLAMALRQTLIELHGARLASHGQQSKMEQMYQYLSGPRFRHRIEAIVERFTEMQDDLNRERRATTKMWARREEQIRGAIESTAGMFGDLQGIAGRSIQEIEGLDLLMLDGPREAAE